MSLRPAKEGCERIALKAFSRDEGEVSVGNVSITADGEVEKRFLRVAERVSSERARRATARFEYFGEERIRAMPVP